MIFLALAILAIPAGIVIGCITTKNETKDIKAFSILFCTFFALVGAFILIVVSTIFAPKITSENLIFKSEIELTYTNNNLFSEIEDSSTDNILSCIEGRNTKKVYIIKSDNYNDVTLQKYVLRNTFWYFNLADNPIYCLFIPTGVNVEAVP